MGLMQKQFADLITFTRASGGGRFNASGQYEWLPANVPRIDYDPVTGECLGLLIEEQRTNLLTHSSDFANAAWVKTNATVDTQSTASPLGVADAQKIVASAITATHLISQGKTFTATPHTYSAYLKASEYKTGYLRAYDGATFFGALFDAESLTVSSVSNCTATILPVGNGWVRCSITFTPLAAYGYCYLYPNTVTQFSGDGTSGIYIWGAQLEAGSFPTPYIPTADAQVTRAADVPSVDTLSPWFNANEGTIFVEAQTFATANLPSLFHLSNDFFAFTNAGLATKTFYLNGRGTTGFATTTSAKPKNGLTRYAVSFDSTGAEASLDGGPSVANERLQISAVSRLLLGMKLTGGAGGYLNGHIRSIRYYPKRLSGTELQALTA